MQGGAYGTGWQVGELLTVREVARLLHVHPNTLRRWSAKGVIKAHRMDLSPLAKVMPAEALT